MNPDLRTIEAAILGEPYDPSNLSPEAASVVLPLVQRVMQERDELREALEEARLTLAAEQGKAEGALPEWQWDGARYFMRTDGNGAVWRSVSGPDFWRWRIPGAEEVSVPTARAAMLAADAALTFR